MIEATDVIVVGGGVMGLWAALKAAEAGLSVTVLDAATTGSGASGGLLGALFPWMPDRWTDKKQYQFDALVSLPDEIARLEVLTGLRAHYRRTGRVIPLPKPHLRDIARRHAADAAVNWRRDGAVFSWDLCDGVPASLAIAPDSCAAGHVVDSLAARLSPRSLIAVLRAALLTHPGVEIVERARLVALDPATGRAEVAGGPQRSFGHAILAAGAGSFPLIEMLLPPLPQPLGQGVKGQAALLAADLDPAGPVVFLDGLYVVPHEGGFAAVGSTSENSYSDPHATDAGLDDVVARARALIPALAHAPVVERWAGVRPKAVGRDPMVGPLPGHPNVIALTGGFKISFGVAHRLAASALDAVCATAAAPLPEAFTLTGQLARELGWKAGEAQA
jgi:glycine oxidase